jgi:predicted Zn-dependent protease
MPDGGLDENMGRNLARREGRAMRTLAALSLVLSLGGCASLESVGVPPLSNVVPAEAPKTLSIDSPASLEAKRLAATFGGEYRAPTAEAYLNDILAKLAQASETPGETAYKVTILNSPVINAFALPSGNLFVTRGLLALANDSAEIAAVMAHEIGHVTARHAYARAEREKEAAVVSQAASVIQSRQKGEEVEALKKQTLAGFSRQQELEADGIGIRTIARAGFDPYGASRFLTSLGRSTALRASLVGQVKASDKPDMLSTHPSTPERISQAVAAARQISGPGIGARDKAGYLASIDRMAFGDDPAEGYARGRKFVHPRLGFAFMAPDGFVLENSAQALVGIKNGGTEALRLDSARVPTETPLETYIGSGWIDGLIQSSLETTEINGLPAVLATARAGEWNFRLAAIRKGEDVYRLIFAARALTSEADGRFKASIASFRATTPEEAADLKPLRLSIVKAGTAQTAEEIARGMAIADRPLEHFLLLNGLEAAGPLTPGESYKTIVE